MTRKLQILRGTTAQNNAYTGAVGELTMDTDRNEVRIHDGQTVGGIKIGERNMPLLTPMWSDHILNDMSWLHADTFSWHSEDFYKAVYDHLAADIDGKTAEEETVDNITVSFYRADDGHKICTPDQESNLVALYEATGVAWYYILDTDNKQFKLPRTKWGFTGLRDSVGGYVAPGLPNITGVMSLVGASNSGFYSSYDSTSAIYASGSKNAQLNNQSGGTTNDRINIDAARSNAIYGASDTVQPPATQMYLYFYVGSFEQSAIEQTAGITAETLNGKADKDLGNIPTNYDYVIESQLPTADNGYTWYRKYKSGWVEQGGDGISVAETNSKTVTLPIPMEDTRYAAFVADNTYDVGGAPEINVGIQKYSTTQVRIFAQYLQPNTVTVNWQVSGMSA